MRIYNIFVVQLCDKQLSIQIPREKMVQKTISICIPLWSKTVKDFKKHYWQRCSPECMEPKISLDLDKAHFSTEKY